MSDIGLTLRRCPITAVRMGRWMSLQNVKIQGTEGIENNKKSSVTLGKVNIPNFKTCKWLTSGILMATGCWVD